MSQDLAFLKQKAEGIGRGADSVVESSRKTWNLRRKEINAVLQKEKKTALHLMDKQVTEAFGAQRRVLEFCRFVVREFVALSFWIPNAFTP